MNSTWQTDRPSAWELAFPGALLLVLLLVPLGVVDFFPISSAPMFNEEPRLYCDYQVQDGSGRELPLEWFHLHRNDNGNPPGFGHGKVPKWSVDRLGKQPTREAVIEAVKTGLREQGLSGPVQVSWWVVGDVDGNRIGILERHQVEVDAR